MTRASILIAVLGLGLAVSAQAQGTDAESHFNAGLMHLRENRFDMAVDQFKQAVKADPKNAYALKGLGISYMRQSDYNRAIDAFRKALEVNPYYVDVRNDLGTALILAGKRAEGKAEFVTALNEATNPTPEVSARNLGQAYYEEQNYAESANWYLSSITRNKQYVDAYLGLADALVAQGRVEDALRHLEMGVKESAGNACIVAVLGEVNFRAGRFSDARARYEEAARKDPLGSCGRRAVESMKSLPR
jgi:tetratricopeptide (TPR) repeat protein